MTAAEIVASTSISAVWAALGGGPIRNGRARAFWRDGDGDQALHIDEAKACWFDHRDGRGGGVLDLIGIVRECDRQAALRWLADLDGVTLDDRPMTRAERHQYAVRVRAEESDQRDCRRWAMIAALLADKCLESLDSDDRDREVMTKLLRKIRGASEAAMLSEYRAWRELDTELTRSMVWAGARHEQRAQQLVARFVATELTETEAEHGTAV